MDPTYEETSADPCCEQIPVTYINTIREIKSPQIQLSRQRDIDVIFCAKRLYEENDRLKKKISDSSSIEYRRARKVTNEYENIGSGPFINRSAMKLANLDALFNFSLHTGGFLNFQTPGPFLFLDIGGGPGGFTEYLQFRRPGAVGYGLTLKKTLDYVRENIDMSRFDILYGNDGTGNILTNWKYIISETKRDGNSIDLVVSDIVVSPKSESDVRNMEKLNLIPNILTIIVTLSILRIGGNFVFSIFEANSKISGQLLFLLSCCFDSVSLIKPVTSRPANSERYVVAQGFLGDSDRTILDLLTQVIEGIQSDEIPVSLFNDDLPLEFIEWLTNINNLCLEIQNRTLEDIHKFMIGNKIRTVKANLAKCMILWNVPSA